MKRVLLTGATGLIGANAINPLVEQGFEVHAVARKGPVADLPAGVIWHELDLLDPAAVEKLLDQERPEYLLHFAWYAEHGKFWSSTENLRWVEGSLSLLSAFQRNGGRRAVLAGTCAEYDWDYGWLSEATTPLTPATFYGAAKDGLRRVAEAFAQESELSLAWGRIFFLYGPRENPARLVPSVIRSLLAGEEAKTTEGTQVRDFMHVEDVARAFCVLLTSQIEGTVNVASGKPISISDVVEMIGAEVGNPELIRRGAVPQRPGEPPMLVADTRRLEDEVGFAPNFTLRDGIEETIRWWRDA